MQSLSFIKVCFDSYVEKLLHTSYRSRAHVSVSLSLRKELEISFLFERKSSRVFRYPISYLDQESTENETAVFGHPRGAVPSLV